MEELNKLSFLLAILLPLIVTAEEYTKLFVVGGSSVGEDVEVIDLKATIQNCSKPRDFPKGRSGLVGTYIMGKIIVCGGYLDTECYYYDKAVNSWTPAPPMRNPHYKAANIMINENTWWVIGSEERDQTSELFTIGETEGWRDFVTVPDLGEGICVVRLNSTHFLFGGGEYSVGNFYIYDMDNDVFTKSESATFASPQYPVCGGIRDDITSDVSEIIVAGGKEYNDAMAAARAYDLDGYVSIPDLPKAVESAQTIEFGNSFFYVGGSGALFDGDTGDFIEFVSNEAGWRRMDVRMRLPRSSFAAFLVPDDAVDCP